MRNEVQVFWVAKTLLARQDARVLRLGDSESLTCSAGCTTFYGSELRKPVHARRRTRVNLLKF